MKIICAQCKNIIGEQKPFNDLSETKATCIACIEKAKEEAALFVPEPAPGEGKEVMLENGMKGILAIVPPLHIIGDGCVYSDKII